MKDKEFIQWQAFIQEYPDAFSGWFQQLKWFRNIFPKNERDYHETPQCDGCYELLTPTQDINEWIMNHFPHRDEVSRKLPTRAIDPKYGWDRVSFHIRRDSIRDANLSDYVLDFP